MLSGRLAEALITDVPTAKAELMELRQLERCEEGLRLRGELKTRATLEALRELSLMAEAGDEARRDQGGRHRALSPNDHHADQLALVTALLTALLTVCHALSHCSAVVYSLRFECRR
jgi:hypothetical protein